jgi:Zn-dependent oligopeptidase
LHPGKELREMSRKEVLKISEIFTKYSYKQEVYLQVKKYYETVFPKEKRKLSKEEIMIVEDSMRSFKRMGLHLPKDKRDKIVSLKNQKSKLSSEYQTNSTKNYDKGIWFSLADLDGLSAEAVAILRHDPKKKKYFVSLRPGELLEVLKHCKVERTRDRITELRAKGVGEVNSKKLRQILKIRVELSKILGFKTPAHFYMSEQMVSDPSKAKSSALDLLKDMTPKFIKEKEEAKKYLNIGEEIKSSNFFFWKHWLKLRCESR